jgi:hypothetical protein
MGLFDRKLKPGANLTGVPADRLLREYAATAGAVAYISETNAAAEFATRENPATLDVSRFATSMNDMILHAEIGAELKRRGLVPPA